MTPPIIPPSHPSDSARAVHAPAALPGRDAGFHDSFGVMVADILDGFICGHDPAVECGWIATDAGVRLGSIFCMRQDAQTAKLRLFQLSGEVRGQGLGHRLLET